MNTSNLVAFDAWITSLGRTRCTGYRWRKMGLIETCNIFGKLYISREEIERFEKRAENGEFAQDVKKPVRRSRKSTEANTFPLPVFNSGSNAAPRSAVAPFQKSEEG